MAAVRLYSHDVSLMLVCVIAATAVQPAAGTVIFISDQP
jgi:hypothetical protein